VDQDQDGINDIFVDQDGDGVNDLDARVVDLDGDGVCDNVVDSNGDGVNDISGLKYSRFSLQGNRYGFMDEGRAIASAGFQDEDGDRDPSRPACGSRGPMDYFIDEDGDGICDGRTVRGRLSESRFGRVWQVGRQGRNKGNEKGKGRSGS
jgi:hypothetical protein